MDDSKITSSVPTDQPLAHTCEKQTCQVIFLHTHIHTHTHTHTHTHVPIVLKGEINNLRRGVEICGKLRIEEVNGEEVRVWKLCTDKYSTYI